MPSKSKQAKKVSGGTAPTGSRRAEVPTPDKSSHPSVPNWPKMEPLVPSTELSLNNVLADQIVTIPNFWPAALCKAYVSFLSTLPLTTTPGKPKKGDAVRVNDRYQVFDESFAAQLWSSTSLREMVSRPVVDGVELSADESQKLWGGTLLGLNPNIRVYRYSKGQFFDQHYDDSNNIDFPSSHDLSSVKAKTTWTLLLYLSSAATGCKGGETVFYPDPPNKRDAAPSPIVVDLEVGMLLLHRHGKDCMIHEGREVTEGEKWVIRSDLCVKR